MALVAALAPVEARADNEPLVAVPADAVVARTELGPAWATLGGDRELDAALHGGVTINHRLAAADLELDAGPNAELVALHPSVGVKIKILSTPENMGYTYVHAGARIARGGGDTRVAPVIGARDFITYDLAGRLAFALQWRAQLSFDDLEIGGGLAVGVAWAEESVGNVAVLVGWKRDRVEIGGAVFRSDGVTALASHQWR